MAGDRAESVHIGVGIFDWGLRIFVILIVRVLRLNDSRD